MILIMMQIISCFHSISSKLRTLGTLLDSRYLHCNALVVYDMDGMRETLSLLRHRVLVVQEKTLFTLCSRRSRKDSTPPYQAHSMV